MKEIIKENGDAIRIQETEFKGKKYLDIRQFYMGDTEYLPTKKGVMIPIELKDKIVDAITSL